MEHIINGKKTAILIYDQFCNFEIAPAMELLAIARKPVTVFARTLAPVVSEEGLTILPKLTIDELKLEEYDSLLLPGARDIRDVIEDKEILRFIRRFDGMVIGAISIAPLLLLKAGMLNGKAFMAGVNMEDLLEEGYTYEELKLMKGWDDNLKEPASGGYIRSGNIVTSISRNFLNWTLAVGEMLQIPVHPEVFGIYNR